MATTRYISVQDYLELTSKPVSEYIDGVLRPKLFASKLHSRMQKRMALLIDARFPAYEVLPELTVRLRDAEFLVPDIAVALRDDNEEPYPTRPVHLCIEVLSPEDRLGRMFSKCEEYHDWGVPYCWIIDPEKHRAWTYPNGGEPLPATDLLQAGVIELLLANVFES